MWEALIGVCALLFLNLVVVIFYYGKMVQKVDSFDYPMVITTLTRIENQVSNHLTTETSEMKQAIKDLNDTVRALELSVGNMQTMLKMHRDEKG